LGAVQAGMLRELTRRGVSAGFVVGSSVGAMNASYLQARQIPPGLRNWERFGVRYAGMTCFLRRALGPPRALLRGSKQKRPSPAQKPRPRRGADGGDDAYPQRIPGRHEKR
jgi:hypothetical protein